MEKEFLAVSDGIFTLQETENKNQFYFYRNDSEGLNDISREPMDLYRAYIMQKLMNGEITYIVTNDIYSETSDDCKCIKLIIYDIGQKPEHCRKKHSSLKRLFHKIFR